MDFRKRMQYSINAAPYACITGIVYMIVIFIIIEILDKTPQGRSILDFILKPFFSIVQIFAILSIIIAIMIANEKMSPKK